MTVRIAAVGDPGHLEDQQSLARARALSRQGAPDLEWSPLTVGEPGAQGLEGYDAVWLMAWPQAPEAEGVRRAAWQAHATGTPVLVSPTEPPAGFVGQARERAAYRIRGEHRAAEAARIEAGEREPRTYVSQMRGPRHRGWRPLVALAVAAGVWVLGAFVVFLPTLFLVDSEEEMANPVNPWASVSLNLVLALLIPATLLGLWVGFRRSPWRVLSVTGRLRWGWLGWCLLVVTPLWAAYLVITWFVFDQEVLDRPEHWVALLVITLLTTPLQAAGEEIAFRGGLVQGVGAWFRTPVVALVVTTVLSTAFFAAAHGSADVWVVIEPRVPRRRGLLARLADRGARGGHRPARRQQRAHHGHRHPARRARGVLRRRVDAGVTRLGRHERRRHRHRHRGPAPAGETAWHRPRRVEHPRHRLTPPTDCDFAE